jgi:signal transduction histidine kinase
VKPPPRLRRGLILLIAAFGAALALTYAWVVPRLVLDTEDAIFARQLERLREQAARPDAAGALLTAPGVRVVRDLAGEPPELAAFLRGLPPGVHDFYDDPLPGLSTTELLVAVDVDAAGAPARWILYDVADFEVLEGPWSARYFGAIGGGFALALLATLVGLLAARRLFGALDDLARLVGSEPPEHASAAEQRDDEIGGIARLWRDADARLRQALARERRFTRDASHELRTPIAAARGALDLLRAEPEAGPARRAELQRRVDAALVEMGDLVHAFLWLAREPAPALPGLDREVFALGELVGRLVDERRALAAEGAAIAWRRGADALVEGSARLARVVVGNVLGNALNHGDGAVDVVVDGAQLTVRNAAPRRAGRGTVEGFGFGLAIAGDLCARFGWRLETREDDGAFTVVLDFAGRADAAAG